MDLDVPHSIEVITVTTPGSSGRSAIPLQIELEKFPTQQELDGHDTKMRRPVRPIDRQRMRPWLMELLDLGNVFGLKWTDRQQGIFQISWRHASRLGWNLETDGDVFERWARHTGIYKEGDPPEPKRWKANFRCALHSLNDVIELTNAVERRGRNACRTYRFLQSGDDQAIGRKKAKAKRQILTQGHWTEVEGQSYVGHDQEIREVKLEHYQRQIHQPSMTEMVIESMTMDGTQTLALDGPNARVIVQEMSVKGEEAGEEYGLQHDHDYMGMDKNDKTILLRQGIGSIVLQKEVFAQSSEHDGGGKNFFVSNLDQLASAAMSSEGLEPAHFEEVVSSRTPKKTPRQPKIKKTRNDLVDAIRKSDFSLKHLLTGGKDADDDQVYDDPLKRAVASISEEPEFPNSSTYTKSRKYKISEPATTDSCARVEGPRIIIREGSPKILSRRVKKVKQDEEDNSESPEPLMSSCLLLLEAATRLDKAEKETSDDPEEIESCNTIVKIEPTEESMLDEENIEVGEENVIIETIVEQEVPILEYEVAGEEVAVEQIKVEEFVEEYIENQGEIVHSDEGTSEIIGTPIELGDADEPQMQAVKDFLEKYSVTMSGGKMVVMKNSASMSGKKIVVVKDKNPEAMGLFSGSSIQSTSVDSNIGNRRVSNGQTFVDIHKNSLQSSSNSKTVEISETVLETTGSLNMEVDEGSSMIDNQEASHLTNIGKIQTPSGRTIQLKKVLSPPQNTNPISKVLNQNMHSQSYVTINQGSRTIRVPASAFNSSNKVVSPVKASGSAGPKTFILTKNAGAQPSQNMKIRVVHSNKQSQSLSSLGSGSNILIKQDEQSHDVESSEEAVSTPQKVNVTAQLVIDPVKGAMLKLPFQIQDSIAQSQYNHSPLKVTYSSRSTISARDSSPDYLAGYEPILVNSKPSFETEKTSPVSSSTLSLLRTHLQSDGSQFPDAEVHVEHLPSSSGDAGEKFDETEEHCVTHEQPTDQCVEVTVPTEDRSVVLDSYVSGENPEEEIKTLSEMCKTVLANLLGQGSEGGNENLVLVFENYVQENFEGSGVRVEQQDPEYVEISEDVSGGNFISQEEEVIIAESSEGSPSAAKRRRYDSTLEMDPTAPLSLGEVPLFASSRGDSDSLSTHSDD